MNNVGRMILERLAVAIPLLFLISLGVFALVHVAPGDPVRALLGTKSADPETLAALREKYHLNDPFIVQYGKWLWQVLQGDLGRSINGNRKVWNAIADKQRGGARLKLPVKVISARPDRLEAALSEDNQARNKADLDISMAFPLRPLPAVGSNIFIIGSLSDYRPRPFMFFLTKAELAEESMPVAGGACAEPRPKMCTQEYRPACGSRKDGSRKTYGNACSACADAEVVSQAAGACP